MYCFDYNVSAATRRAIVRVVRSLTFHPHTVRRSDRDGLKFCEHAERTYCADIAEIVYSPHRHIHCIKDVQENVT